MMRRILSYLSALFVYAFVYTESYANNFYVNPTQKTSIGDVANNIVEVQLAAKSFIHFLCVSCGIGLVFASLYHFKLWWRNRQHRPFSRPLLFLLFGLALIALVFFPMPLPN